MLCVVSNWFLLFVWNGINRRENRDVSRVGLMGEGVSGRFYTVEMWDTITVIEESILICIRLKINSSLIRTISINNHPLNHPLHKK